MATAVADMANNPWTQSDETSSAGDTASETDGDADDTAVAALKRQQRRAPKAPVHGNPALHRSAKRNSEPEVGNFGLFFGNWGMRGTVGGTGAQRLRREIQDRQILKSPGQVVIVAEATGQLEESLRQPLVEGSPDQGGLQGEKHKRTLCGARRRAIGSSDCRSHG